LESPAPQKKAENNFNLNVNKNMTYEVMHAGGCLESKMFIYIPMGYRKQNLYRGTSAVLGGHF
jgi:hypothetical protein